MLKKNPFRLSIYLLLGVIIYYTTIGIVNYTVDPDYLLHKKSEVSFTFDNTIADMLISGYNVANIDLCNERLVKKIYAESTKERLNVLILGSSRIMSMRANFFGSKKVFSCAVSGASLHDILAFFYLFEKRDMLPETIILGIDPWLFNAGSPDYRWRYLAEEYQAEAKRLGLVEEKIPTPAMDKNEIHWRKLFSFGYFKTALKALRKENVRQPIAIAPFPVQDPFQEVAVVCSDGSAVYAREFRSTTKDEAAKRAVTYLNGNIYRLENFKALDPALQNEFEYFVRRALSLGVQVKFFLSPYHPVVYTYLENTDKYTAFFEVEPFILRFADTMGIEVYGSLSPKTCAVDGGSFFDAMHPREEAIRKIFTAGPVKRSSGR